MTVGGKSYAAGSLLAWYLEAGDNLIEISGVGLNELDTRVRLLHYDRYIAL